MNFNLLMQIFVALGLGIKRNWHIFAGIILGINQNTNYSLETARNAISETAENAHRNNFSNDVIENVTNYTANNNQTEVKFNTEEIVEIVNKVVNNKPSEAITKDDNQVDKKLNENAEAINVNNSEKAEIEVVNNQFTMPNKSVYITPTYTSNVVNPETADTVLILIALTLIVAFVWKKVYKKYLWLK